MDKANILAWVKIENPDKELMQFDEIRAKYEHLRYLGKKAIEPVEKNWNIINFQLRFISLTIENLIKTIKKQQQIINKLSKRITKTS